MNTRLTDNESGSPGTRPLNPASLDSFIIGPDDRVLVTGAAGFIGSRVLESLLERGFRNVVCLVRPSSDLAKLEASIKSRPPGTRVEVLRGNLLSRADCEATSKGVAVIYHLAAGTGEKSFPDAFMNSVVTTRNLLEASAQHTCLKRFVLVSSFAVYSNRQLEEVLVDFWVNHFNVYNGKGQDRLYLTGFERDAIRPYVLGHFKDMLMATARHPAMLFYLDNWQSQVPRDDLPGMQPPPPGAQRS